MRSQTEVHLKTPVKRLEDYDFGQCEKLTLLPPRPVLRADEIRRTVVPAGFGNQVGCRLRAKISARSNRGTYSRQRK